MEEAGGKEGRGEGDVCEGDLGWRKLEEEGRGEGDVQCRRSGVEEAGGKEGRGEGDVQCSAGDLQGGGSWRKGGKR